MIARFSGAVRFLSGSALVAVAITLVVLLPSPRPAGVSVGSGSTVPGGRLALPVSLVAAGEKITAIQFDLSYNPDVLNISATVGDAARRAGKTLYFSGPEPGRKRLLLAGVNTSPIGDGSVATLFVTPRTDAASGAYHVDFLGLCATDSQGTVRRLAATNGQLTVQH